uniref:Uncharacterized protein n=1 Tax=Romanomermis culicivorax TaxID=13658 RepID=A0A915HX10_ROMCU
MRANSKLSDSHVSDSQLSEFSTCGFNTLSSRSSKGKNFNNPKLSSGGLMNFRRSVGNIQFDQGIAAAAIGASLDDPSYAKGEAATAAAIVNHCKGSFTKRSSGAVMYTAAPSSSKVKFYDLCFTTSSFPRYHHHFKGGCYILSSGNRPTCDVRRATELCDQPMSPPPFGKLIRNV